MNKAILITGATGNLGRAIVRAALKAGLRVRQGVRDTAKANPDAPGVRFDYTDPETIAPALTGVTGLLLIAPPLDATAPAKLAPVIATAKETGIRHIVFISALGANLNEQSPLAVIERAVAESGIPYTILRPSFFMENFSEGFLAGSIKAQNAIFLAAADAKTSFISTADIADVAVTVLSQDITGAAFDLSGPAALDHAEAARITSEAIGRTVTYHALTEEQMLDGARSLGMPEPAVEYLANLYRAVRAGFAAGVTGDVEKITGHKPTNFEEFARTSAAAWK